MFSNPQFDRVRQLFADQFSPDTGGFIYRKNQKGAPIRISDLERDDFLATFNRRIRYAAWSIVPATIGLILILFLLFPETDSPEAQIAIWVGVAAMLAPFMVIYRWAWNAPARELQRRTPEGAELTKEEARELAFSKITYGNLMLAALIGLWLIWDSSTKVDVFHGWGVVWLVFGIALIALAGIQALRKWRFGKK